MRRGMNPKDAVEDAISRIRRFYPTFLGALVAVSLNGEHAAATNG
jgi:hypothetical protein